MLRAVLVSVVIGLFVCPVSIAQDIPEVARTQLEQADRYRESGQVDRAIQAYEQVIRIAPGVSSAYVSLGALQHQQGRSSEALETFLRGLDADPGNESLLSNATAVATSLGRLPEVLERANRALEGRTGTASLHALRGTILRGLERHEEALADYEQAVRLEPRDAKLHFSLGNAAASLGRSDRAIEAYRRAIELDSGMLRAHYNLGAILFEAGRFDEALESYRVAVAPIEASLAKGETVPAIHAKAFQNLGAIYLRSERWPEALSAYEKARTIDDSLASAHYNIGFISYRTGDSKRAEAAYVRALELDPALPLAYLHLGRILYARGDMTAAEQRTRQGLPYFDDSSRRDARLVMAAALASSGRETEARAAVAEILEGQPEDAGALALLARLERHAGRSAEAAALLERAARTSPSDRAVRLEQAALASATGRLAEARALYEGLQQEPAGEATKWLIRANLAVLKAREGSQEEARREMTALLARVPTEPDTSAAVRQLRADLATALVIDGQLAEAAREIELATAGGESGKSAANTLAVVNALTGQSAQAIDRLSKMPATGWAGADIAASNLGVLLWSASDTGEARKYLHGGESKFPEWTALSVASAEAALARGEASAAVRALDRVVRVDCSASAPARPAGSLLLTPVEPSEHRRLCTRASRSLATALLAEAAEAGGGRETRAQIDRALALSTDARTRSAALFARGTESLAAGDNVAARADLEEALRAGLSLDLAPAARNNLGIALSRLALYRQAEKELLEARRLGFAEAIFNLGILYEAHLERPRDAIAMYTEYAGQGTARASDARGGIERLKAGRQ